MKIKHILFVIFFGIIHQLNAQISISNTQNPVQLVQDVLLGTGIVASNITWNGTALAAQSPKLQIGYFEDSASTFPISRGVVMSTGNIATLPGLSGAFSSTQMNGGSDPDLATISGVNIDDAAVLAFDFVAIGDSMNFKYMFGSEEYPEFVGGSVNDAFGFFISGPGINGPFSNSSINLAIIPGTTTAVSINTVSPVTNTSFYTSNNTNIFGTSTTLDGYTTVLVAMAGLQCGGTYRIKMAIGDGGDDVYDSAVFLEAESFSSNVVTIEAQSNIIGSFTDTILAENCTSTNLLFIRPEFSVDSSQTFNITFSGTATIADFSGLSNTVTFPVGVDTVSFIITPINDGITEPMEFIQIKGFTVTVCGDTIFDSLTLYIVDRYELDFFMFDTVVTSCAPNQATVNIIDFNGSIGPFNILWDFGDTINPVLMPTNGSLPDTITYFVTVTDGCNNDFIDSVAVIYNVTLPQIQILPNDTVFVDCIPDSARVNVGLMTSASGPFTYLWSNGSTNDTTFMYDAGVNNADVPFSVSLTDGCGNIATANGILSVRRTLVIDTIFMGPSAACSPTGFLSGVLAGVNDSIDPNLGVRYNWTGPGPGSTNSFNGSVITNLSSGWYYFTASDDACFVSDSAFVTVQNPPTAAATATPTAGFAPLNVIFTNQSQNTSTYQWDFGNGQTANTSDLSSVSATYNEPGVYTIRLIASQGANCNDTIFLTVTVVPPPIIPPVFAPIWEIPNVFTPNGDQSNDLFFIETQNVSTVQMVIFNRWGNVMYERSGPNPAWDGLSNSGAPAQDGVYFYKIILTGTDGSTTPLDGFLQLVR